jgi:hypothetical protein
LVTRVQTLVRKLRNVHYKVGPETQIHPDDIDNYLIPNAHIRLELNLAQLKVRVLEAEIRESPPSVEKVAELASARKKLEDLAVSSILND